MANIAVIGTGYVGLVSGACLADFGNTVVCVDNNAEKIESLKKGAIPIFEPGLEEVVERNSRGGRLSFTTDFAAAVKGAEAAFIAVGTPPQDDGSADLKYVEEVARGIGRAMERYLVVVDKSTVPVGTARRVRQWVEDEQRQRGASIEFDVVSNPEFLREGTAVYDFAHPDRVVIGGESEKARATMKEIYRPLYLGETPYIETNLESAEMCKYASNAFLAVKISYINEIANLCEKTGADVLAVAKAMGRDGRIGGKFLHPGPGFGGSCFPKDTRAIAKTGRDASSPLTIIEAAVAANDAQRQKMIEKIEAGMGEVKGKTIAILGLAFKLNTDDMREAPSIDICEGLATRGASLRVYDPAAMKEAAWRLASIKDAVYFAQDEYDAAQGADAIAIVTEWNQFRSLALPRLFSAMKAGSRFFFDLRNIYKRGEAEGAGFEYYGVGR
jgi:UDPglucose 6-dehydrogenase